MSRPEAKLIQNVIAATPNGELIGRIRMQKTIYLLSQIMDIDAEYNFDYHRFGPYSEKLAKN